MKLNFNVTIENDVTQNEFGRVNDIIGLSKEKYKSLCERELQEQLKSVRARNKETVVVTSACITFDENRRENTP